jgi:Ran GTPase-activating protein (RanGAP) involved in mRNA processing and transport
VEKKIDEHFSYYFKTNPCQLISKDLTQEKDIKTFEKYFSKCESFELINSIFNVKILKILSKKIKFLKIHNCTLEQTEALVLADFLSGNTTLKYLDLSINKISPQEVSTLAKALKGNQTLEHLNLMGNSMGTLGRESLKDILTKNTTLQFLDLSFINITKFAFDSLALALNGKKTYRI